MKKWKLMMAAGLLAPAMLMPVCREMDDGGSKEYASLLYSVTLRRAMTEQNGQEGVLAGIEIRVLGILVYDDVSFVPNGQRNAYRYCEGQEFIV